jgi:hypothetical protein
MVVDDGAILGLDLQQSVMMRCGSWRAGRRDPSDRRSHALH